MPPGRIHSRPSPPSVPCHPRGVLSAGLANRTHPLSLSVAHTPAHVSPSIRRRSHTLEVMISSVFVTSEMKRIAVTARSQRLVIVSFIYILSVRWKWFDVASSRAKHTVTHVPAGVSCISSPSRLHHHLRLKWTLREQTRDSPLTHIIIANNTLPSQPP